jgi:hypothetical protein
MLALFHHAVGLPRRRHFSRLRLKQYRRAGSLAVSLLLGTYFLSILPGLNRDLDFLKYFTPFKYFDAGHAAARIEI